MHNFANKGAYSQSYGFPSSQSCGFPSSHVRIWELHHKEGWALKNWCFQIVVLEKTLESPLDCKEIQPVNPKGDRPCIFIGRTDAKGEAPIPPILYLTWRADSLEKILMLGKTEGSRRGRRGSDGWMASLTQWTWIWANSGKEWRTGAWWAAVHGVAELDTTY